MSAGRYKPGVVRLGPHLKTEAQPQIVRLKPVGEYGHRLVLFFFNDTATTEIYTLSLHDALPIYHRGRDGPDHDLAGDATGHPADALDRKSTRLNSSHGSISYAVFCLKKQNIVSEGDGPLHCLVARADAHDQTVRSTTESRGMVHTSTSSLSSTRRAPFFFFFNEPAPPETSTFPPTAALPI